MLILDDFTQNQIHSLLLDEKWHINSINDMGSLNTYGLLNSPVQKIIIKHDGTETPIIVKALGPEPQFLFRKLYEVFGHATSLQLKEFDRYCYFLSICDMPTRERFFYENYNKVLNDYIPHFFGSIQNRDGQRHLLIEDLSKCHCINKSETPKDWGNKEINLALETLAFFHTINLCSAIVKKQDKTKSDYSGISNFLKSLEMSMQINSGMRRIELVDKAADVYISAIEQYEELLHDYKVNLTHHDFNIRNMCIDENTQHLKVYDWEFIDYESPIMDLADFLLSLSPAALETYYLDNWLDIYHKKLYSRGKQLSVYDIKLLLYVNLLKFSATRMNMYLLFYCQRKMPYKERIYSNLALLLRSLSGQIKI